MWKLFKEKNYSREETIRGNMVHDYETCVSTALKAVVKHKKMNIFHEISLFSVKNLLLVSCYNNINSNGGSTNFQTFDASNS